MTTDVEEEDASAAEAEDRVEEDAEEQEQQLHRQSSQYQTRMVQSHRPRGEQQTPTRSSQTQPSITITGIIVTHADGMSPPGTTAAHARPIIVKMAIKRGARESTLTHTSRQDTAPARQQSTRPPYQPICRHIRLDREGQHR